MSAEQDADVDTDDEPPRTSPRLLVLSELDASIRVGISNRAALEAVLSRANAIAELLASGPIEIVGGGASA